MRSFANWVSSVKSLELHPKSSGGSRISPRWRLQPLGGGVDANTQFPQKLHEIERIWIEGGVSTKFYYVDPPLKRFISFVLSQSIIFPQILDA